jgi:hypothetical protein
MVRENSAGLILGSRSDPVFIRIAQARSAQRRACALAGAVRVSQPSLCCTSTHLPQAAASKGCMLDVLARCSSAIELRMGTASH